MAAKTAAAFLQVAVLLLAGPGPAPAAAFSLSDLFSSCLPGGATAKPPPKHPALPREPSCPKERYRPLVHYTPRAMFMNDPNGLLYAYGEWHLFYQYNPEGEVAYNVSWGHAVSPDLIHWTELSGAGNPAIPNVGFTEFIFSGSVVVDEANTSGLGTEENPPMVAIYTSANETIQAQSLAYSLDKGRTWTKYAGNPVLDVRVNKTPIEFRDPKVRWYEPIQRWLMAVSISDDRLIRFYSSPDLKTWTKLSDFGPMGAGAVDGQYECPDLFQLPVDDNPRETKWVLIVNVNPGGRYGGSGAQYFIGNFDGERFVPDNPDPKAINWLDYGKDYYAAISWEGAPDGKRYMIGWMSNWEYSELTPTTPWTNAMSVPRLMSLRRNSAGGLDLLQEPIPQLVPVLGRKVGNPVDYEVKAGVTALVADNCYDAYMMEVTVSMVGGATAAAVVVRAAEEANFGTSIVWNAEDGWLAVDRSHCGWTFFSEEFPGVHGAPLTKESLRDGKLRLQILVDASSVEVFADGGRVAITDTTFPFPGFTAVLLEAAGPPGSSVQFSNLSIVPLRSYRKRCPAAKTSCRLKPKAVSIKAFQSLIAECKTSAPSVLTGKFSVADPELA